MINLLSVLSFFLLPVIIGRAIMVAGDAGRKNLINYFISGSLVLFALALGEKYLFLTLFPKISFISLFRTSVLIITIIALGINFFSQITNPFSNFKKYLLPVLTSLLLAGIVFYLWQINTPYSLNWDFLEHQTLVNNILNNRFSFLTSRISDTFGFNGYSSIFHLLLTTSQMFFSVSIVNFWNAISFTHLFLVILSAYFLTLTVTRDELVALLSAILSAFVFETITFTNLFFLPQTLTAVIFILVFTQLLKGYNNNQLPPLKLILINCLFLFLNHYIIGFVAVSIYILTYLYFRFEKTIKLKFSLVSLLEIGVILAILFLLLSPLLPLKTLNFGEAEFYTFSLKEKLDFFKQAYGYSLFIFLPIGILAILRKKLKAEILILIIAILLLVLVFSGIPYAFKFFVLGRFFVNLIMALGIVSIIFRIKNFHLQNLALSGLIIIFAIILTANSLVWKNLLNYHNILTLISPNEISASEFLKKNYAGNGVLLISDPATQNILEGLSGVNSAGGAYMNQKNREQLSQNQLFRINDQLIPNNSKRLFVLSGRYFRWQQMDLKQKQALNFNVWTPYDLTFNDYKYILKLTENGNFQLIYQNPTLVILEANQNAL